MTVESRCGLICSECDYQEKMNCPTCTVMDKPFWGDGCVIKSCCESRGHTHCGECQEIPCEQLTAFSYSESPDGDDGARIRQCGEWQAAAQKERLVAYALTKPGVTLDYKEEWGWDRLQVGDKLFLSFARMQGERPIVTIKLQPEHGDFLQKQYPNEIIPGYYMNKEHWNTIYLDLPWTTGFFLPLIDEAYAIVLKSLSKKKQREILEEN